MNCNFVYNGGSQECCIGEHIYFAGIVLIFGEVVAHDENSTVGCKHVSC